MLLEKYRPLFIKKTGVIKGTVDEFDFNFLKESFLSGDESIFIVVPNLYRAQSFYDNLCQLINPDDCLFFPCDELISSQMLLSNDEFRFERIHTINELIKSNTKKMIITHLTGALKVERPKRIWESSHLSLVLNREYDIDDVALIINNLGYERVYTVEKVGQYAKRGSILDVYPFNSEYAYRLDFDFDELTSIKIFDIETQRSSKKTIEQLEIAPIFELFYSDDELKQVIEKISSLNVKEDIEALKNRENLGIMAKYIAFFDDDNTNIFSFRDNKKIYFVEEETQKTMYSQMVKDIHNFTSTKGELSILKLGNYKTIDEILAYPHVSLMHAYDDYISDDVYDIKCSSFSKYDGNFLKLVQDLKDNLLTKTIIISFDDEKRFNHFKKFLLDNNLGYNIVSNNNIVDKTINLTMQKYAPVILDDYFVLNEDYIYNHHKVKIRAKYKAIFKNSKKINNHEELKVGDYIVHYDRGIGRYLGLKTMEIDGLKRDYLHIEYAKDVSLYIAIEEISSIQKYSGSEGVKPKLSTIGGSDWAKTKLKVKSKINDISDRLIKLYAMRKDAQGFAFASDTKEEEDFAKDFGYEETSDQMQAINDVKNDMMSTRPMDRLVCGDVGYGKTEVALRGAFKAIMNGKQVAYLVPTTILARQHYYTFKKRMEKYGVNVALLSRMVPLKERKLIISGLLSGTVDVVVGTHALLSKDIKFKDLGLLITDEEQRFGVSHKEKIKEMKVNVDSIMLSATPIPRTLQMSLLGIKELSMISTPPKNRYPVQTYVIKRNDTIIKEAIEHELSRNGQVFYLYNRTDNIEEMCDHIKKIVPEAKVCFAHGKLDKNVLEDTLIRFIDHEFNVMVCTTIIETGIDIPDSNTLIIHDADKLGLSQLYQIRGRVGRSDKVAYAYLLYDDNKVLTSDAIKRLEVIKEFTELGSGFKIALRDLSIRGAGDLLGDEQSGFIDSVGLDLYMKILEDTILEKQGKKEVEKEVTLIQPIKSNRFINDEYIANDDVKIEIHKRIFALQTLAEANDLKEELIDRFGEIDEELEEYIYEKLFDNLCIKLDIERIIKDKNDEILEYMMSKEQSDKVDGEKLFMLASSISSAISFNYKNYKISIIINKRLMGSKWLYLMANFFDGIAKM